MIKIIIVALIGGALLSTYALCRAASDADDAMSMKNKKE